MNRIAGFIMFAFESLPRLIRPDTEIPRCGWRTSGWFLAEYACWTRSIRKNIGDHKSRSLRHSGSCLTATIRSFRKTVTVTMIVVTTVVSRLQTICQTFQSAVTIVLTLLLMVVSMGLEARHPAEVKAVSRFRHGYATEGRRVVILMMDRHH